MLKGGVRAHSRLASGDVYISFWPREPVLVLVLRLMPDSSRFRQPCWLPKAAPGREIQ